MNVAADLRNFGVEKILPKSPLVTYDEVVRVQTWTPLSEAIQLS